MNEKPQLCREDSASDAIIPEDSASDAIIPYQFLHRARSPTRQAFPATVSFHNAQIQ